MRRAMLITTASLLALLTAGPALAQQVSSIQVGDVVEGRLDDGDARVDSGDEGRFVYDTYSLSAAEGQRLEIVMRSEAFDAYLQVLDGADPDRIVDADDDGLGDGTDSRIRITATGDGFLIRARTLDGLEGGDYVLSVTDRGPAQTAGPATPIRLGDTVEGTLSADDPVEASSDDGEYVYDAYVIRAEAGARIAISLDSDDFDALVRVGRLGADGVFEELAQNDDSGGGGLNSYLVFTASEAGDYVIRAASLGGEAEGAYTLKVEAAPAPLDSRPLSLGETVDGALGDDDGLNASGQRAEAYGIELTAGQRIIATMNADDFDTYLELFGPDGASVAADDDGGAEGTNSRLVHTAETAGRYTLEARAFSGEGGGDYTLTLEEARPDPAPTPIAFGATVRGEIEDDDPTDDENRRFDAYRFTGEAGNRVQAVMRSGDFDTFLQIGSAEGEFVALASDDDGLGEGTDSRLTYILPSSGDFIVRASPLSSDATGVYSLELIDRGPQPTTGSILVGATARGTLTEDDALSDDGGYYDAYRIRVKAGDKLRLTLVSNAFDAYLDIGREDEDGAFTSVTSDDDSLSDTHAKVDWEVEDDGDYVIRARSFAQGQTGAYVLTVEPRP